MRSTSFRASGLQTPSYATHHHRIPPRRSEHCIRERCDADKKQLFVSLRDVEQLDSIAPVAPGAVLFALEHLGAKNVRAGSDWSPSTTRAREDPVPVPGTEGEAQPDDDFVRGS